MEIAILILKDSLDEQIQQLKDTTTRRDKAEYKPILKTLDKAIANLEKWIVEIKAAIVVLEAHENKITT